MASLVRRAKSGSDWTLNDLVTYNIHVQEQNQDYFFGGKLPDYTGPPGFVQHEERVNDLDASSLALIKRLDLPLKMGECDESAVDDFVSDLLREMSCETPDTVVRTQKNIRLSMCGQLVYTKTDVCVLDINSKILLLVQDVKSHVSPSDPEAQLIAEAIGAFQENNAKRTRDLFLEPLERQVIPGVTMVGTPPRFYKMTITADLDRCIRFGQYPTMPTVVYRHTPRVPRRRGDGMKPLDNRRLALQCFEAFKRIVFPKPGEQA